MHDYSIVEYRSNPSLEDYQLGTYLQKSIQGHGEKAPETHDEDQTRRLNFSIGKYMNHWMIIYLVSDERSFHGLLKGIDSDSNLFLIETEVFYGIPNSKPAYLGSVCIPYKHVARLLWRSSFSCV